MGVELNRIPCWRHARGATCLEVQRLFLLKHVRSRDRGPIPNRTGASALNSQCPITLSGNRMSGKRSEPSFRHAGRDGQLKVRTGGSGRGERQPRPTEPDAWLEQSSPHLWKCGQVPTTPTHHRQGCRSTVSAGQCDGVNSDGQADRTGRVDCGAPNRLRYVDGCRHCGHGLPIAKSRRLSESGPRMAAGSLKRSSSADGDI